MPTLDWIGKNKVVTHHQDVPFRVLDHKYTFGDTPDSGNMIIHGDNLEALKSLLPEYEGKINCIYIDPPYNTGNEGWVYNDNVNDPHIRKWLGKVVGSELDDLTRHDKWLCMMYPRLVLLKKLLSENGAVFISIDDNEQTNLKLICDEIFGRKNFVEMVIWGKKNAAKGVPPRNMIVNVHEYILVYQGEKGFKFSGEKRDITSFKNPDNDPRGPWRVSNIKSTIKSKNAAFTITNPANGKEYTNTWAFSKESLEQMIKENRILWKDSLPKQKEFLYEMTNENMAIKSYWGVFDPQSTTVFLKNLNIEFNNAKPISLLSYLFEVSSKENDIILDSFAGSGTTAHAILNLNKRDGGNRKFILCEMCDYAETITAQRVRYVINGYGEGSNAVEGTGGSFDFYELGETLFDPVSDNLNDNADTEQIRRYIWFSETNSPYLKPDKDAHPYLLGTFQNNNYYFYYIKGEETCLDWDFLRTFTKKDKAEMYIIYADRCILTEEEMTKLNIRFKKIPRDIKRV